MNFLVISHTHGLLPFANRLSWEGYFVDVIVWQHHAENAWKGQIEPALRGSEGQVKREYLEPYKEQAAAGELIVVSDVLVMNDAFEEAKHFYGTRRFTRGDTAASPVRVGGWFDGTQFVQEHVLLVDHGLWPGGLGPARDGGLLLVNVEPRGALQEALLGQTDRLKSSGFKGLVQLAFSEDGEPGALIGGWPTLHTHAWVSELENFAGTLHGEAPELGARYIAALPVSVPPYPMDSTSKRHSEKGIEVGGLTSEGVGKFFWHDVEIDKDAQQLKLAGLDGFVGVARGKSSLTPDLAVQQARLLAAAVALPQKQYRPDFGSQVGTLLAGLEGMGALSLG